MNLLQTSNYRPDDFNLWGLHVDGYDWTATAFIVFGALMLIGLIVNYKQNKDKTQLAFFLFIALSVLITGIVIFFAYGSPSHNA